MSNQAIITRNPFHSGSWHLWLPADPDSSQWARVDLWSRTTTLDEYISIGMIYTGTVYEGKVFRGYDGNDWTENGTWNNNAAGFYEYRQNSNQNEYTDVLIPANHNRIILWSYDVTGGGGASMSFAWDDGTTSGLDLTSYDSGTATQLYGIVIAENASPDGIKSLRITNTDTAGSLRLLGLQTWNTDSVGDPSTTNGANTMMGHDIIAHIYQGDTDYEINCIQVNRFGSAIEFAIGWKPIAEASAKWTGGYAHLTAGNAPYRFSVAEWQNNGPTLYVDGSSIGGLLTLSNKALYTGGICIYSEGFADYDEDDVQDANEPDVRWMTNADGSGMSVLIGFDWKADSFSSVLYSPMLAMTSSATGLWYTPQDGTSYTIPTDVEESVYNMGSVDAEINGAIPTIHMSTIGPCDRSFLISTDPPKLYCQHKNECFPSGTSPVNGDQWIFGGRWEFNKKSKPKTYNSIYANTSKVIR